MHQRRLWLLAIVWLLPLASAGATEGQPDPREKLETAIPEAMRLLQAKENATFLRNFVPPEELKKIQEKKSIDELAKWFGKNKSERLLKVLDAIKNVKPQLDTAGTEATFVLPLPVMRKNEIRFVKVGRYWYLHN